MLLLCQAKRYQIARGDGPRACPQKGQNNMDKEDIIELIRSREKRWSQATEFYRERATLDPEHRQHHEQAGHDANVRSTELLYLLDQIEQADK